MRYNFPSIWLSLGALVASPVFAHTWIEEMQVISPNGTFIGDRGYSRGYVARTDPTFDGDDNVLWMLPALEARGQNNVVRLRINSSDLLCHPNQRTANYSNPLYPKLKVAPGDYVAMKYLENGHTTLPWNQPGKPDKGGTAFIYGTTQPSATEKIADVLKWTTDGKGGDGRGFLMSAQTYDDSRCHQINSCVMSAERQVLYPNMIPSQPTSPSQEQWCESDIKIPSGQAPGTLSVYWIWQWPTEAGAECVYPEGKDEYYTTCSDFEVMGDNTTYAKIAADNAHHTLIQENFQTTAVADFKSRTALTPSPTIILSEWTATAISSVSLAASFQRSCSNQMLSAQAAASAGVVPKPPPSCPEDKWATGALFASVSSSVLSAKKAGAFLSTSGGPKGYIVQAGATPVSASMASSTSAPAYPSAYPTLSTSSAPTNMVTVTTTQEITATATSTSYSQVTKTITVLPIPASDTAAPVNSGLSYISTVGTLPTTAAGSSSSAQALTTSLSTSSPATSPSTHTCTESPASTGSDTPYIPVVSGPGGIIGEVPDGSKLAAGHRRLHGRQFR